MFKEILKNSLKFTIGATLIFLFYIIRKFFFLRFSYCHSGRIGHLCGNIDNYLSSRKKNEYGFPKKSIEFCINKAGIKKKDISYVAVSTKFLPPRYFMVKRNTNFSVDDYKKEQNYYWWPIFYQNKKKKYLEVFKDKIVRNQIYDFSKLKSEDDTIGMQEIRKEAVSKFLDISRDKIFFYDHHLCHANYAYYSCPEKKN